MPNSLFNWGALCHLTVVGKHDGTDRTTNTAESNTAVYR